jgi:hypothetical protein
MTNFADYLKVMTLVSLQVPPATPQDSQAPAALRGARNTEELHDPFRGV